MDDLTLFCCQNPECSHYGQRGLDNLRVCLGPSVKTGPVSSVRTEPVDAQTSAPDRWYAPSTASARGHFSRGVVGIPGCGVTS
jgi:hypothetical protein